MKKYRMVTMYSVYVGHRVFETTDNEVRRDELLDLLPKFYPNEKIWAESERKRKYI